MTQVSICQNAEWIHVQSVCLVEGKNGSISMCPFGRMQNESMSKVSICWKWNGSMSKVSVWQNAERTYFLAVAIPFVIDSNPFWPKWSLLLAKSTWCSTPSRWPWPRTCTSRGSARTRRTVNVLTRVEPDLVPLMELTLTERSYNSWLEINLHRISAGPNYPIYD